MKNNEKRKVLYITLLSLILISAWAVDIAVSASLTETYITNGFWSMNPDKLYHIALYIIVVCSFIMTILK